ncbi:hypothetical protein ACD661_04870 [Legionella lytica]|uniref:Uncharacterized protein n=1 Tax=Legionella lytica TaxID=96232 RepID=A0ABW8D5C1_9GAMM
MPHPILTLMQEEKSISSLQAYCKKHNQKLPLFVSFPELQNKTVYQYLKKYQKLNKISLAELIEHYLVDFTEVDEENHNLMDNLVADDDFPCFQQLLLCGQKPTALIFANSELTSIGDFLRYRPGKNSSSVYEYATKRKTDMDYLYNLMLDYEDTTDEESSEAELSDTEELSPEEQKAYEKLQKKLIKKYNETGETEPSLVCVAARGVHFVPKYFPKPTRNAVIASRKQPHTTFSFSTLIDAGYEAGDEPEEDDAQIVAIHQRNTQFVAELQITPDRKEKRTEGHPPPAARNNKKFDSLYWREIQAYINSYSVLFNKKGIQTNFSFASLNNPHISLSWKTEVAGMYSSGVRFGWKRGERRDPHYRRCNAIPKHPTVGYIDVYELPLDYVRTEGVDRLLAYNDRLIDLSNIHLSEAEIIFHSMIPKEHHVLRFMVIMPSFNAPSAANRKDFGMQNSGAYTRARNDLFACISQQSKGEKYQKWVTQRAEHAVSAQATLIDKTMDVRLFKSGRARAYNHGEEQDLSTTLPTPSR